jgi:hypothetical protein
VNDRHDNYLNDFHREYSERLKAHVAKQPKATLEEALAQYQRIKRQSARRKPAFENSEPIALVGEQVL